MIKSPLLTLFVSVLLFACKTDQKKEQINTEQNSLVYDTAKTAIISWNKNSDYPFESKIMLLQS